MTTTKTGATKCPVCKTRFDAATSISGEHVPKVGDFSLCVRCGQPLRFGRGLVPYAINLDAVRVSVSRRDFATYVKARNLILARRPN